MSAEENRLTSKEDQLETEKDLGGGFLGTIMDSQREKSGEEVQNLNLSSDKDFGRNYGNHAKDQRDIIDFSNGVDLIYMEGERSRVVNDDLRLNNDGLGPIANSEVESCKSMITDMGIDEPIIEQILSGPRVDSVGNELYITSNPTMGGGIDEISLVKDNIVPLVIDDEVHKKKETIGKQLWKKAARSNATVEGNLALAVTGLKRKNFMVEDGFNDGTKKPKTDPSESETKANHQQMELVRVHLGFAGKLVVDKIGKGGGLCMFWSAQVSIILLPYSRFHIDVKVLFHDSKVWRLTGFYGNSEPSLRHNACRLLQRLKSMSSMSWLCFGDFNEILAESDKYGGVPYPQHLMDKFREALDDYKLGDLGFSGPCFTWLNKRIEGLVMERLDREVCSFSWKQLFLHSKVSNLEFWSSDHHALLIKVTGSPESVCRVYKRRFHFEACWVDDKECRNLITTN
ncbi:hypothetical protein Ddye_005873 [Dipteronia dyeriana]|uniref:Reverse transcriptase n=1 Tax=Dipteronia dyeriana TaxID=168575 RepID=A0AAD9XGY2_9ROSI|nr:hypothetical protein Ddye_005873 [Dipteronia dyeriana]